MILYKVGFSFFKLMNVNKIRIFWLISKIMWYEEKTLERGLGGFFVSFSVVLLLVILDSVFFISNIILFISKSAGVREI